MRKEQSRGWMEGEGRVNANKSTLCKRHKSRAESPDTSPQGLTQTLTKGRSPGRARHCFWSAWCLRKAQKPRPPLPRRWESHVPGQGTKSRHLYPFSPGTYSHFPNVGWQVCKISLQKGIPCFVQ